MTQRTRSHILEDESRYEFRRSLPAAWVCRDKQDDYGIDCEVEIFTNKGQATGLVFWVQLKATDAIDDSAIKKLYFEREKIRQFLSYDIPVLIVRYVSNSKTFYLRWAKGLQFPPSESQSIPVFFPESCRWTNKSPFDISCYLQAQNLVKQGKVNLPIPVFIGKAFDVEATSIPYTNLNFVKTCLGSFTDYVSIRRDPQEALLFIRVCKRTVFMSLADIQCAEMKVTFEKLTNEHIPELTKHFLVVFCSLMFDFGRKEIANNLIIKEGLFRTIFKSSKYLISILPKLLESERFEQVLEKLEDHIRKDPTGTMDVQFALSVWLTERRNALEPGCIAAIGKFHENELAFQNQRGNRMAIAHAHYNFAQHFKAIGETRAAIGHYMQARRYGEFYKRAHYYFSDLAGLLFSLDKFRFAAAFYRKAIDLGAKEPIFRALGADALMYSGFYEEAKNQLDEYLLANAEKPDNEEWQLKYSLLATMLAAGYPVIQARNVRLAGELVKEGNYVEAIEQDFLCRSAWYGVGIDLVKSCKYQDAFAALTFSALLFRDDPYIWAISLLTGMDAGVDRVLLIFVVRVAHEYTGAEFSSEVHRVFSKANPESVDQVLELIDQTIKDIVRKPVKIRSFSEDGTFEEILF